MNYRGPIGECYLITNRVKNNESKKRPFRTCLPARLADRIMFMKKGKKSSYLIYNNNSLGKMADEYGLVKYLENLTIEKTCCYHESY